jgi:penicillin amidase
MKFIKLLISAALVSGLFYLLNFQLGQLPPLGKLLNPSSGFWQNNASKSKIPEMLDLPGLKEEVQVIYDKRHVPHIFAKNSHDLYFAMGYIYARDRLWQMEMQTSLAAGRLSEVLGKATIETDRYHRRMGLMYGAEKTLEEIMAHPESRSAGQAYAAGVNAYIHKLDYKSLPLEYKILDFRPEEWTVLKSALMLKLMSLRLSSRNSEAAMSRTRDALGEDVMDALFPINPVFPEPIIPVDSPWNFNPEVPEKPEKHYPFKKAAGKGPEEETYFPGSNNWAVSGALSSTGYPILCNDPHLGLTLPSIWYEIQLSAPGINVYGVTLPGVPAVIIGFNEHIAWGLTNAGSDVFDWYDVKFKDKSQREYFYDGEWRPVSTRVEEIKVKNGPSIEDPVIYTHHGPVVFTESDSSSFENVPPGCALRWTAHDPSDELAAFLKLNRAENYDDYIEALSYFDCPAQNFVFADSAGDIAIQHNGEFPLRWPGQGRYISDGSDPAYDWKGRVPRTDLPHIKNPERGFVSSANQEPADAGYPYYLGWSFASFTRGARINERLKEMRVISPDDMRRLQTDTLDMRSRAVLPGLLTLLEDEKLTQVEKAAFEKMKLWSFEFKAELIGPTIFDYWWKELNDFIWKDDMESPDGKLKRPGTDVTLDLILNKPGSPYFDIKNTEKKESLKDLTLLSFKAAIQKLKEEFGPMEESWAWGNTKGTDINHLAGIPGLNRKNLETDGDAGIVNATSRTFGPSWRMVVALGPELKAWGIYPGGQSGDPGSEFYDNMIDDWVKGKLYELHFLKKPEINEEYFAGKTVLRGKK